VGAPHLAVHAAVAAHLGGYVVDPEAAPEAPGWYGPKGFHFDVSCILFYIKNIRTAFSPSQLLMYIKREGIIKGDV
jgi:hypothetical protein